MFGIVPDGPGPGPRPAFIHPVRRWSGEGDPLADDDEPDYTCETIMECLEKCMAQDIADKCCCAPDENGRWGCKYGECPGGGDGGGDGDDGDDGEGEGSGDGSGDDDDEDDDWWEDIWDFFRCGDVRDRLASEYGVIGKFLCWALWLHGDKWIVPESQGIEYGVPHGEYGLVTGKLRSLVSDVEDEFGFILEVTSGYRCPIGNRDAGGRALSQHPYGLAYDFESTVPGVWNEQMKADIVEWVIERGNYAEQYDDPRKPHIHMQVLPKVPIPNPFADY